MTGFSKPRNDAEVMYVLTFTEATAAIKIHHEQDAERLWRKMEQQPGLKSREYRGWVLYAKGKADALTRSIERRRETVTDLLSRALLPEKLANSEAARRYSSDSLKDIINRFEAYPDVADLVARARAALPPDEKNPNEANEPAKSVEPPRS